MKTFAITLFLAWITIVPSMAQTIPGEKLVPEAVKTKFKSEYPSAVVKRWEPKNFTKEYTALFTDNKLTKRARYKADGTLVFTHIHYPAAAVPSVYTTKVLVENPGYKVDWANEWKNFVNGNHVIEIRLTKPGYILKAFVKPDGTIITDEKMLKEADEDIQSDPSDK